MSKRPQEKPAHSRARRAFGSVKGSTSIAPSAWLFSRRIFGRDFGVAGGGGLHICRDGSIDGASGPADSSGKHVEHEFVGPVFRTVAHGGVEDAAFTLVTRPNNRIGSALVG